MKQSFQAGVDTLYNKCVSCGWTPTGKTPTHIEEAIQGIYGNRYTEGYNAGKSAVTSQGKSAFLIASGVNSSRTINISSYTDNVGAVTVNDFIVQITNMNAYMTSWGHPSDRGGPATNNNFNPVTLGYSGGNLSITINVPTYSSGTYGQTGGGNCRLTATCDIYFLKKK